MCKYCEGDNQEKENIMITENFAPVCIWEENGKYYLLIDQGENDMEEINYCPKCGRKLN